MRPLTAARSGRWEVVPWATALACAAQDWFDTHSEPALERRE